VFRRRIGYAPSRSRSHLSRALLIPPTSADPNSFASFRAHGALGSIMPILVAAAIAALGLTAREVAVAHHQHDVSLQVQARMLAIHDPACQDSLRYATTDSARATIVDGCVQRILANGMSITPGNRVSVVR